MDYNYSNPAETGNTALIDRPQLIVTRHYNVTQDAVKDLGIFFTILIIMSLYNTWVRSTSLPSTGLG